MKTISIIRFCLCACCSIWGLSSCVPPNYANHTTASASAGTYSVKQTGRSAAAASHAANGDLETGARLLNWNNQASINNMIQSGQFDTLQNIRRILGCNAHATGSDQSGKYSIWHYAWSSSDLKHHWQGRLIVRSKGNNVVSVVYHAVLEDGQNRFRGNQSLVGKIEHVQATWNISSGSSQYPGLHKALHASVDKLNSVTIPYIARQGEAIKNNMLNQRPDVGQAIANGISQGLVTGISSTYNAPTPSSDTSGRSSTRVKSRTTVTVPKRYCNYCDNTGWVSEKAVNYTGGADRYYKKPCPSCR